MKTPYGTDLLANKVKLEVSEPEDGGIYKITFLIGITRLDFSWEESRILAEKLYRFGVRQHAELNKSNL